MGREPHGARICSVRFSRHRHTPCTVTEAPPELPQTLSGGVSQFHLRPISTEGATLQGGWLGLRLAGGHSAGRLLSSSVPGVPSALALTELDHPRTGRVAVSPTRWIDARCRKHACIACTLCMQPCVAMGRVFSSTPPPQVCALGMRLFRL